MRSLSADPSYCLLAASLGADYFFIVAPSAMDPVFPLSTSPNPPTRVRDIGSHVCLSGVLPEVPLTLPSSLITNALLGSFQKHTSHHPTA
jgi:hypothetical protein